MIPAPVTYRSFCEERLKIIRELLTTLAFTLEERGLPEHQIHAISEELDRLQFAIRKIPEFFRS